MQETEKALLLQGQKGNYFGRTYAALIAASIGAIMPSPDSNEAIHNNKRIVIKCARRKTSKIGVSYKMLNRLDFVLAAFECIDGSFDLHCLSAEIFKENMKNTKSKGPSAGKVGVISKNEFIARGKFEGKINIDSNNKLKKPRTT